MSDIFREVDEDLRREQFKRLWDRYGRYVLGLAVLIVARHRRLSRLGVLERPAGAGERRSLRCRAQALGRRQACRGGGRACRDRQGRQRRLSGPRRASALPAEKLAAGDDKGAVAEFDAIARARARRPLIRDLARLRAALILVETASLADLQTRIGDLADTGNPWRHSAREILGLAAWRASDFATARKYFEEIADDQEAPQDLRQRAQFMLALITARLGAPAGTPQPPKPETQPEGGRSRLVTGTARWRQSHSASPSSAGRMSASRRCSTGWSAGGWRWSTISPGVTRDRREGEARLGDLSFTAIDTAGLDDAAPESLAGRMRAQTEAAIRSADLSLFLIDARAGVTPLDCAFRRAAARRRQADRARRQQGGRAEPARPARSRPSTSVSASRSRSPPSTARGWATSTARSSPMSTPARRRTSDPPKTSRPSGDQGRGRRPAERRQVDADQPHDRRGAPAHRAGGRHHARLDRRRLDLARARFRLFDTAGLRRKARVEGKLEKLAVGDALRAIRFAEVVILVLDVAAAVREAGPADRRPRRARGPRDRHCARQMGPGRRPPGDASRSSAREAERLLPQLAGVPLVPVSGLTGEGIDKLMEAVLRAHATWNRRVPTAGSTAGSARWWSAIRRRRSPAAGSSSAT